jgi:alpha-mannosidase
VVYPASETQRSDFSATDWVEVANESRGLTVINYGNQRCHYDAAPTQHAPIRLSVILGYAGSFLYSNGGYHFLEGEHTFRYSLLPHVGQRTAAANSRTAWEANNPLLVTGTRAWRVAEMRPAEGELDPVGAFCTVDANSVAVSTAMLDEGTLVLRLVEYGGQVDPISLSLPWPIASARVVDLQGNELRACTPVEGALRLDLGPYELVTLRVALA